MNLFTWLFKDEAEAIKERLNQADRDNRALERKLDELKERVRISESQLRELSIDRVYHEAGIPRPLPIKARRGSRQSIDNTYTPTDSGPDLATGMLVTSMVLSGGWDSSSSSYDNSSSSSDSGSSGGGE